MKPVEEIVPLFTSLGFTEKEAVESSKNKKLVQDVVTVDEVVKGITLNNTQRGLLKKLLASMTAPARPAISYLVKAVVDERIERDIQVKRKHLHLAPLQKYLALAAIKFCEASPSSIDDQEFDKASGV
ncbi:hypothetical protein EV182_006979, partial [Spiromyces aspiralis]